MLGRLVLAPIVRTFLAEFPQVSATLTLLDRPTSLVEEGFDLALRVAPITDADLTGRQVGETRRVLVASPGYARARGLPDSPSDLMDHNIVGFERFMATSTWQLTQAGRAMTVTVRPRFMVNDAASAKEAALAGEGITMLLSYQVGHSIRRGELIPVLANYWPAATPIWLVHPSHARAAHIRAFADWSFRRLRDDIAEHCAFGPVVEKPTGDRSRVGHKAT